MDVWTNGCPGEWTDGRVFAGMVGKLAGWVRVPVDEGKEGCADEGADERTDEQTNGRADERMNR